MGKCIVFLDECGLVEVADSRKEIYPEDLVLQDKAGKPTGLVIRQGRKLMPILHEQVANGVVIKIFTSRQGGLWHLVQGTCLKTGVKKFPENKIEVKEIIHDSSAKSLTLLNQLAQSTSIEDIIIFDSRKSVTGQDSELKEAGFNVIAFDNSDIVTSLSNVLKKQFDLLQSPVRPRIHDKSSRKKDADTGVDAAQAVSNFMQGVANVTKLIKDVAADRQAQAAACQTESDNDFDGRRNVDRFGSGFGNDLNDEFGRPSLSTSRHISSEFVRTPKKATPKKETPKKTQADQEETGSINSATFNTLHNAFGDSSIQEEESSQDPSLQLAVKEAFPLVELMDEVMSKASGITKRGEGKEISDQNSESKLKDKNSRMKLLLLIRNAVESKRNQLIAKTEEQGNIGEMAVLKSKLREKLLSNKPSSKVKEFQNYFAEMFYLFGLIAAQQQRWTPGVFRKPCATMGSAIVDCLNTTQYDCFKLYLTQVERHSSRLADPKSQMTNAELLTLDVFLLNLVHDPDLTLGDKKVSASFASDQLDALKKAIRFRFAPQNFIPHDELNTVIHRGMKSGAEFKTLADYAHGETMHQEPRTDIRDWVRAGKRCPKVIDEAPKVSAKPQSDLSSVSGGRHPNRG